MKIEINKKTYEALGELVTGFMTPEQVIIKLLNHYHGEGKFEDITPVPVTKSADGKDRTKYVFQGKTYGKAKLVHAIVKEYVTDNPTINYDELEEVFPPELQGSLSVIMNFEEAGAEYKDATVKRYYIVDGMKIQLTDVAIGICNQWGAGNIDNILEVAESLNYMVTIKGMDEEEIEVTERQCRICGEWKLIADHFSYGKTKHRHQWCKDCCDEYSHLRKTDAEGTATWIDGVRESWDYKYRKVNKDR